MNEGVSRLTERGQISIPAGLRRKMDLRPGHRLRWEVISPTEVRLVVEPDAAPDPEKALGYGPRLRAGKARRTADWMRELRSGE